MKDIINFLVLFCQENLLLVSIALSVICALIPSRFNIIKIILRSLLKMVRKFRTEQTALVSSKETKGQIFEQTKPVYRLNKTTGELVQTEDTINIKELINSAVNLALDNVLDRFLPISSKENQVVEYNSMQDDLDYLIGASQIAEDYKHKFQLDDSLSMQEVFDFVSTQANELKASIDKAEAVEKAKAELLKKGVNKNEEKIIEETK